MAKSKNKKRQNAGTTRKKQTKQDELTRLGAALRGLGYMGGNALGSLVGMPLGQAGKDFGAGVSKWLGSGDYTVSANSLVSSARNSVPMMHKDDQTIIVRHKEFIGEIQGNTTFTVRHNYDINPGNRDLFPWLSQIAQHFQEYRMKGMVYHYVPTSGTAVSSSNAALGSVMFQTSYRAGDAPPGTKRELLNEYWSTETVPYEAVCHPIECDPKENPYNLHYVTNGFIPGGDPMLYNLGTTFVAVSGMQTSNQVVGDLWVTYEVELKKPLIASDVTSGTSTLSAFILDNAGSITGTTLFNGTTNKEGALADTITFVNNTISLSAASSGYFQFYICVRAVTNFTGFSFVNPTLTNCTTAPIASGATFNTSTLGGTTPTLSRGFIEFAVLKTSTSAPATMAFSAGTLTGAVNVVDMVCYQLDAAAY